MDYIIEISGFDPERGEIRTERKTIREAWLSEAARIADSWMEQSSFAAEVSIYELPGGAFDCLASRRRRGAWEIVKRLNQV